MKKTILLSLVAFTTLISSVGLGWVETTPTQKLYTFKFKLKAVSYEFSRTAPSYEEAYESAAQACFNHYKGNRHLAEDEGLDIIDTCANPRI